MASTCRIVEAVRGGEGESLSCVDDHAGVNAMTVPTVLSKEGGRVVLRLRHQETIVASETQRVLRAYHFTPPPTLPTKKVVSPVTPRPARSNIVRPPIPPAPYTREAPRLAAVTIPLTL